MATKILILAEHSSGALKDISFELLGEAHRASADAHVVALLLGNGVSELAAELAKKGASEVIVVESPALENYSSDAYRHEILAAIASEDPDAVLIGNTPNGWDVAPLVAAGLMVPLASGCARIAIADGSAKCARKAFNGKFVHHVEIVDQRPIMATMDKGAAAPFDGETDGSVRTLEPTLDPGKLKSRFVETKKSESGGLDLSQASVIVSGGRGVGAPEKLDVIRELADALGGQLGASRAVTDAGWLPHEHQIGSSGVTVSPKLYVACGISGAIQHVVGMKSSGYIVAINKDPDAPIFGIADVGVVGDLFEIVPALTKQAKEAKG